MDNVKSKAGLKKLFQNMPKDIQSYFHHLEELIDQPRKYDLALAHCFMRIEEAQNRALYAGLVRLLCCDADLARKFVDKQHLTRKSFAELFKNIFGKPIPKSTAAKLEDAQAVRNRLIHGKTATEPQKRQAIADALEYATELSKITVGYVAVNPFGKLTGIVGKLKPNLLNKNQTKWIIVGVGFTAKQAVEEIEL